MNNRGLVIGIVLLACALGAGYWFFWRASPEHFVSRYEDLSEDVDDTFMHALEYGDCDPFMDLCEDYLDLIESRDGRAYMDEIEKKTPLFRLSELAGTAIDSAIVGSVSEVALPCLSKPPGDARWQAIKNRYEHSAPYTRFRAAIFDAGSEIGGMMDRAKKLLTK